jgi:outer membrane protein, adhesin transport system
MLDLYLGRPIWRSLGVAWGLAGLSTTLAAQPVEAGPRVVAAALPVQAAASPSHAVFEGLLTQVISGHPQVRSAQAQGDGAKLDVDVAKWAYWPTVSLSTQRTDGTLSGGQSGSTYTVQQPLWSGGALTARVAAVEKLEQASAEQVNVVRGDVALRLVDVWANLMDAEANRSVTTRTLEWLNRYQAIMERRVSAGLSSAVELKLLAVRVSRAQADLADAQSAAQIAVQRMEQLVAVPLQKALPDLKVPLPQTPLAQWMAQQRPQAATDRLAMHPAVRKAELDAAAAADQLTVQKAQRWPQLVLTYQRRLGDLAAGTDRNLWTLGLNYTPGAGLASLSQSAADSARLRARLEAVDAVRQDKQEQLLQDWATLQREFARQASLASTIDSASDVLASYERLYFGGLKTWLEVLNALQELAQSELRLAQAGNATTLAYYRWRLRGGELPTQPDWMQ